MDDAEHLLPAYLRFVRGVVDSNDLPLNVSREILQESRDVEAIRAGCAQARAAACSRTSPRTTRTKYATFWKEFGRVLKEGVGEDYCEPRAHREARALRLARTPTAPTQERVARRLRRAHEGGAGQDLLRDRRHVRRARSSPHLEIFRKKGVEVLLLSDRVDEWVVANLPEFEGKPLVSVARGDLDLGTLEAEAERDAVRKQADASRDLVGRIKQALGERVKDVRDHRRG